MARELAGKGNGAGLRVEARALKCARTWSGKGARVGAGPRTAVFVGLGATAGAGERTRVWAEHFYQPPSHICPSPQAPQPARLIYPVSAPTYSPCAPPETFTNEAPPSYEDVISGRV